MPPWCWPGSRCRAATWSAPTGSTPRCGNISARSAASPAFRASARHRRASPISTEETNFTLGLAELNARLKRRALVILFTDFVDTITAELLIESMQRVANRHVVIFVTQRGSILQRAVDAAPGQIVDVAKAVIAQEFLRDRSIVFERLAAPRHPLPRRAEPGPVGRPHQPLSHDQATRADMSATDGHARSTPVGGRDRRQAGARAQEQRVPQGPRGRLARARDAGCPRGAARGAPAVALRAATAAGPLPRRAVVAVGRAHHRARPQSPPLPGKPGAAGLPGGLWAAHQPAGRHADLLPLRPAGGGAGGALAYRDRDPGAAGRGRGGLHADTAGRSLAVVPGAVRPRRRTRDRQHARPTSTTRSCSRPGRARSRRSACSPMCCSATIRWSAS